MKYHLFCDKPSIKSQMTRYLLSDKPSIESEMKPLSLRTAKMESETKLRTWDWQYANLLPG